MLAAALGKAGRRVARRRAALVSEAYPEGEYNVNPTTAGAGERGGGGRWRAAAADTLHGTLCVQWPGLLSAWLLKVQCQISPAGLRLSARPPRSDPSARVCPMKQSATYWRDIPRNACAAWALATPSCPTSCWRT
jgi:hypothetical protein